MLRRNQRVGECFLFFLLCPDDLCHVTVIAAHLVCMFIQRLGRSSAAYINHAFFRMIPQECIFRQFSLQHLRNAFLHRWNCFFVNTGIPGFIGLFLCQILSRDTQELDHLGISPHARGFAILQDDMPDTKSGGGNDLIVLQQSLPALLQPSVVFLQFNAGGFFFSDLRTGAPVVAHKQRNNDGGDRQDTQDEYFKMLPHHVKKTVGIQTVGIAVGLVLSIIDTKYIEASV